MSGWGCGRELGWMLARPTTTTTTTGRETGPAESPKGLPGNVSSLWQSSIKQGVVIVILLSIFLPTIQPNVPGGASPQFGTRCGRDFPRKLMHAKKSPPGCRFLMSVPKRLEWAENRLGQKRQRLSSRACVRASTRARLLVRTLETIGPDFQDRLVRTPNAEKQNKTKQKNNEGQKE